jgi:hypothetical protein
VTHDFGLVALPLLGGQSYWLSGSAFQQIYSTSDVARTVWIGRKRVANNNSGRQVPIEIKFELHLSRIFDGGT